MNRITREAPHEAHHFGDRLRLVRRVIPSTFRLTHRHYSIVTPSNHRVARKFAASWRKLTKQWNQALSIDVDPATP